MTMTMMMMMMMEMLLEPDLILRGKREKTEPYSGIRYTHIYPHKLQVEGLTSLTQHFSTKKTIVKNMLRGMED